MAIENFELRRALEKRNDQWSELAARHREIELKLNLIAHDLKNPLFAITGIAELLSVHSGRVLDQKGHQYLASILRIGDRVRRQLDRMLVLYRLSSETIQKQTVDISALAQEIAEEFSTNDQSRRVKLDIKKGLTAFADPDLMHLALENLISNAFKYSRAKELAEICIDVVDEPSEHGGMTIKVEDNGIGFDPTQASLLFQPLKRLHSSSEFSGTGLGLTSVARIVELHGGRVWAEGRPSEGATFFISIPQA